MVYSIKDLENLSGVKAHTLRIWEKRYNIIQPKRTPTNIRYYLDEDLKHVLNIALLNRHGYKISKIAKMDHQEIQHKVAEISDVDISFENQLDVLTISLLELNEDKFVNLIDKHIEEKGFSTTMLEVIYPLLDKLAVMWIAGSIKGIHEKFVSNIIKRKCSVEIDRQSTSRSNKTFLIYLPEGETNDLSLLFLHYLIKSFGYHVINAGANISLYDLFEIADIRNPEFIYTIINDSDQIGELDSYIDKLLEVFNQSTLILSGIQAQSLELADDFKDKVKIVQSSEETISFLKDLSCA